ncbi:MAG: fibronectin type III domain-containing protein [Acidobacteriota bacterium]|nr:fibronectin type III domain-containing protein [Acidobacteriota bacterium]
MNQMRRRTNSQRGMTLPEVLVASAIFLVILVAALMIYDQSNKIFKTSVESADMQQNTRVGFDRLIADVRMAGFDADRDGVPTRAPAGPWRATTNYGANAVVSPSAPNGFSYRAVTGGTSGTLEPNWPTTAGQTFAGDGSVTWMALGPVYQQPDEQIEFAGRSAITIRGNLNYNIVTQANPHHGREAEYEPAGGQFPIVTTSNNEIVTYALRSVSGPNNDALEFYADVAKPRAAYPGGQPERKVRIPNVDLCANGCNNPPYTLLRFTIDDSGNPSDGTPIANNVRDLQFFYYEDMAGQTLLRTAESTPAAIPGNHGAIGGLGQFDPGNIGGTQNWSDRIARSRIQSIRVQLVGMNEQKDAKYTNPTETVDAAKHYRTYNLASLVTPRNLGLSGLPEPATAPPGPPTVTSVCVGACKITRVRWNPPVTGNVGTYEVRYDTSPTGAFNSVGVVVPGDVVSAPVFNLVPGTLYYFKVLAINENGREMSQNYLSRAPVNSTKPGPVANVTVTGGAGALENKITLTWTAPVDNDPSLANVSCQGISQSGQQIDPAEQIRFRVWRGTTPDFNPAASPAQGEVVLDKTVTLQPNGPGGSTITFIDDASNSMQKPPANCKNYYYRVQAYDSCAIDPRPNENLPDTIDTATSRIYPRADTNGVDPAVPAPPLPPGSANSTVPPAQPDVPEIDYDNGSSQCNKGLNTCDVKILITPVIADTSNPTQRITIDQYRVRREKKKRSDTTWVFDANLPVLSNASSDPTLLQGGKVVYHDTTALDHDPNDKRKWYYRYTVTALQCGASSAASDPVYFPQTCKLIDAAVIESGASSGDGSLESPWVMGPNDYIEVQPPAQAQLDRVDFEIFPEPNNNPGAPPTDRRTSTKAPFQYAWDNQTNGQVFRVVITMTNAAGCSEQTERFIQDDPVNCPSATITQTNATAGSGVEALPWVMKAGGKVTVNAPAGGPIANVSFALYNNNTNALVRPATVVVGAPYTYNWIDEIDNQVYRLQMTINYVDACQEVVNRYIMDEPPPVCTGAKMVASGETSGVGTQASPWLLNGGDTLTITPATGAIINQVVFTVTQINPVAAGTTVVTDSVSPFSYTWTDGNDNAIYRVDAVITYANCQTKETVTGYVKDQVCSGGTVSQTGSTGAGTGLTTSSPWVMDAGDVVTVTPATGQTISDVVFRLYNEPGTTVLSSSTDATSPYQYTWVNRVDDALYRLEMTVTYAAGCSETITRYIRDQGTCFLTLSSATVTNADEGSRAIGTITYVVTNPTAEALTIKGIKVDWLRDALHPVATLREIVFVSGATSTTLTVSANTPPTTGVLTVSPTPPLIGANSSTYQIRFRYDLGQKQTVPDLLTSWISKLCIQYTAPSFGGSTASCNVLGATNGNPTSCN